MMAHDADDYGDANPDIFVYRGGRAPQHVTHVIIDKSVDEIEESAFSHCMRLLGVETHNGIRKVGKNAFNNCKFLRRINLKYAVEIDEAAFFDCNDLADVEFGDNLETIGESAFAFCESLDLEHIKLSSVVTIEAFAFMTCRRLIDIELSERLETLGAGAFDGCIQLQRVAIPLKRDLFAFDVELEGYTQFRYCEQLVTVDLVGGIHKTVASLHMERWRADMQEEINRINDVLPSTPADENTDVIRQWMELTLDKMDHYEAEHYRHVKEGITLLELALWKAKLGENEEPDAERRTKKVKVDAENARKERRITCGADIVIKNVLPFLQLE